MKAKKGSGGMVGTCWCSSARGGTVLEHMKRRLYMAWSKLERTVAWLNGRVSQALMSSQKAKNRQLLSVLVDSLFKCSASYSSFLNDEPLTPAPPPPLVLLALLFLCNIDCPWGRVSSLFSHGSPTICLLILLPNENKTFYCASYIVYGYI